MGGSADDYLDFVAVKQAVMTSRRQRGFLLVILAIAVLLRCIALNGRGIQYDDAFSYFLSIQSLPDIVRGTAADTMPPLYYFLLHFWAIISPELWFLRLLSILLTLASLWLLYRIVALLAGTKAALWASLFAAVSPLQIYHAQDIRMYALLEFCQLGYAFCLLKAWGSETNTGKPTWGWWIATVLFGAGAMYTHNLAVFGLAAPNFYLLVKRDWKTLRKLLLAQAAIGALALPWLLLIPGQIAKVQQAFWTPRPGLVEAFQAILMWFIHLPLTGVWMALGAILSLQVFVLTLVILWRNRKAIRASGYLLAWAFFPPVILFAISYLIRPVFVPRGFLVSSMAFYGLVGMVAARSGVLGKMLGISVVLAAAISLPFFYTYAEFPRSPFRELSGALQNTIQAGEIIIHDNKLSYFPGHFYQPDLAQVFLPDDPGSSNDTYALQSQQAMQIFPAPNLETAVGNADGVYFVVFSRAIEEYQAAGEDHPAIAWLEARFHQTGQTAFNDLLLLHYQR
ncbi:MAG: hypothetical protein GYA20_11565 [Chloroflexi bacterium]|nr:hypothetical protein [Chloroflexota bacterium]